MDTGKNAASEDTATNQPSFQLFSDEEMINFIDGADSASTKMQIKYSVSGWVFHDQYCKQADINHLNTADLDVLIALKVLHRFEE